MSNAVVGALRVDLGLDSSAFAAGLQNARKSLKGVGQNMTQIGTQMSAAITAPLAGFGALTLKTAGDFEAAMNRVEAALQGSGADIGALTEKARQLGSETSFSATQSAEAIEILAKNGVAAADIMGGALDASLSLAAASASEMGAAADVATDIMANFGKGAAEMGGVVDGVTGVLLQSKFGFEDYRLAIGQAGGVAGALGVELEDFNAVLAATSSSFASGSDAGTSFKTFLQRLVPASKPAAEAMQQLGLEFFDAEGGMKSMAEVAEELREGVAGLNDEARNDALSTIFGQDAIRTALSLAREGADGIDGLKEAIDRASATEQAEARLQGLNGAMKQLSSAFQELQLAIADSGLLEKFTQIVQAVTEVTRRFGEADPRFVQFGVVAASLAAALGPVVAAIGLVLAAVGGPALGLIAAAIAVTAAFVAFRDEIDPLIAALKKLGSDALEYIKNIPPEIVAAFKAMPGQMLQVGKDLMAGLVDGIRGGVASVKDSIAGAATGVLDRAKSVFETQSPSKAFHRIGGWLMDGLRIGIDAGRSRVNATTGDMAGKISGAFEGVFSDVIRDSKSFGDALNSVFQRIGENLISGGLSTISDAIGNAIGGALGQSPGKSAGGAIAGLLGSVLAGARADGGPVTGGKRYLVGERGPEVFEAPTSGRIIPNHELGGGGAFAPVYNIDARGSQMGEGQFRQILAENNQRVMADLQRRMKHGPKDAWGLS